MQCVYGIRTVKSALTVGFIALVAYYFAGHGYLRFYPAGRSQMLQIAAQINQQCSAQRSCPKALAGWQAGDSESVMLSKEDLRYFASPTEGNNDKSGSGEYPAFRLIYRFFPPDHWFEARGGVNQAVSHGWQSREPPIEPVTVERARPFT